MRLNVSIIERTTQRKVPGVVRPAAMSDKVLWTRWHGRMPRDAEDAHWEWDDLMDLAFAMPDQFAVYALEAEGDLQGLRMLEVSQDDVQAHGTHALRLSTAPWNRSPENRYRGVGSILVGTAILRSVDDGHQGSSHCESLPRAEAFHAQNGMVVFNGLSSEGLKRFRFTEDTGRRFVDRLRQEGLLDG